MSRVVLAAFLVAFLGLPGAALAQSGCGTQQAGGEHAAAVLNLARAGQPFAAKISSALQSNPLAAKAILAATKCALEAAGGDEALKDFIAGETAAGFKQAENALRAAGRHEAANYIVAVLNSDAPPVVLTAYTGSGSGNGLWPMTFGGGTGGGGGTMSPTKR